MQFKEWLYLEAGSKAVMEISPEVQPQPKIIGPQGPIEMISPEELSKVVLETLKKFSTKFDPRGWRHNKDRYIFTLKKANYKNSELRVEVGIKIKTKDVAPIMLSPDDEMYQFYPGGDTGKVSHRTPKGAVKEIMPDPNLAYRGMSWEEWQTIQKTGKIQSKGIYNIEQEGMTFFGKDPSTALSYSTFYSPMQYVASSKKPGVVIAVDRKNLIDDDPRIRQDTEMALKGSMPASEIKQVYIIKPEISDVSRSHQIFEYKYKPLWDWRKGYEGPDAGKYILDTEKATEGGANTNPLIGYFIMRLK